MNAETEPIVPENEGEKFLELARRQILRQRFFRGRKFFGSLGLLSSLLLFLLFYYILDDFQNVTKGYFDTVTLAEINDMTKTHKYFGETQLENSYKVVIIYIDGLGYEFTQHGPFADFLNDPSFSPDLKLRKIEAQIPSISVPNWVSFLSSVRPEFSGFIGNNNPSSPLVDHFFMKASHYNLKRGVTGPSLDWDILLKNSLKPLEGDGIIDWNAVEEYPGESTTRHVALDKHDDRAAIILYNALINESLPYSLFLAYFGDVDARGHQYGASSQKYLSAIKNKTEIVRNVINLIDENTVLIITADHGHVDPGGHGGTERSVLEIPFVIYRKNSNLASLQYNGPSIQQNPVTSLNSAPSICAFLGIPVPRESEGVYFEEVFSLINPSKHVILWRDLYKQKQNYILKLIKYSGISYQLSPQVEDEMYDPFTNASLCPDCIEFYINGIIELSTAFLNIRNSIGSYYFTRNALIDFFTSIFYLIVAISVLHFLSLVDVRGLFEISFEHYSLLNKKAFLIAIVLVLISFLFEISFFIIIVQYYLRPAKNWQWDFSLFNSQLDAIYQIFLCIFLGIVFYSFVSRIGYVLSVAYQSKKVLILTLFGFPCRNKDRVNYELLYLIRYYTLFIFILCGNILYCINDVAFSIWPGLLKNYVISEYTWNLRFETMHCAFMLLPCLIGASIHIFYGLPRTAKDFDKKLYSNMWQAKKTRKCLASCKKRSKSFQLQTDIEMQ